MTPVFLDVSETLRILSTSNRRDWWWDMHDQRHAGGMIEPVICASYKTHFTNFSGNQHAWLLYLTSGNIEKNNCSITTKRTRILVALMLCFPNYGKSADKAWHPVVGTLISQLSNVDITGLGLNWDCADGFQRQRYSLLTSWGDVYPDKVMIALVSYGTCPLCEISNDALIWHSTFGPLHNSRDEPDYTELLDEMDIDTLHTIGLRTIRNQFWQYPLWNVHQLWPPDELH